MKKHEVKRLKIKNDRNTSIELLLLALDRGIELDQGLFTKLDRG